MKHAKWQHAVAMLPLSMFRANDNLVAIDKHAVVYITHKTHPAGEKIHSAFLPTITLSHVIHYGASV